MQGENSTDTKREIDCSRHDLMRFDRNNEQEFIMEIFSINKSR